MRLRIALAAGLVLTACAAVGPSSASSLAGSEGRPVKLGDKDVDGLRPFVRFDDNGHIGGNGGCNSYRGSYTLDGNRIEVRRLALTMMYCGGKMQTERALLSSLRRASTFRRKGTKLTLQDSRGRDIAEFVERH